jgi:hypothetical protein
MLVLSLLSLALVAPRDCNVARLGPVHDWLQRVYERNERVETHGMRLRVNEARTPAATSHAPRRSEHARRGSGAQIKMLIISNVWL